MWGTVAPMLSRPNGSPAALSGFWAVAVRARERVFGNLAECRTTDPKVTMSQRSHEMTAKIEPSTSDQTAVGFRCVDFELSGSEDQVLHPGTGLVRVLVKLHQTPLGFITLPAGSTLQSTDIIERATDELGEQILAHLSDDGFGPSAQQDLRSAIELSCPRPTFDEHVSVVIGTRNRPEHVQGCLEKLLDLDYPDFDVIVVDNDPADDATRDVFASAVGHDSRFTYRRLPMAGVSAARNSGIEAARGPLVAFIDDDVRVDRHWLQSLARAFATKPAPTCVTGLIAAHSIDSAEQLYFDSRVSWSANLRPRIYLSTSEDPLHPWAAGRFGAGANMAFRLDAVRALGGFDTDLGPGTLALGGEDIDLFVRALRAGGILRYEPAALAWHLHRSDAAGLERQLFGYGIGLTAYLTKHALQPRVALEMAGKLPRAVRHALKVTAQPAGQHPSDPSTRRYRRIERTGMVLGPLYYLRSRLQHASMRRHRQ